MPDSTSADPGKWLRGPIAAPGLPVFCFPHAGGGASAFRTWQHVPTERLRILAVKLPGREDRLAEPAIRAIDELADPLAGVVEQMARRPYAFFGHSMGALVAFEVIRKLRERSNNGPVHLFVASCQAPDAMPPTHLHDLPKAQFVPAVRSFGGMRGEVLREPALMQLLEPTLRADLALCELYQYRPQPPLACGITVFGGARDTRVTRSSLTGWRRQTAGSFELHIFSEGHFYLESRREQLVGVITDRLKEFAR